MSGMLSPASRRVASKATTARTTARSLSSAQSRSARDRDRSVPTADPFDARVEKAELQALQAAIVFPDDPTVTIRHDSIVQPSTAVAHTEGSDASQSVVNTPRLRFETYHHKVDYRYDGDRTMDTDVMIAKRRRLKQDQGIQTWINVFWRTFHHKHVNEDGGVGDGSGGAGEGNDSDSDSSNENSAMNTARSPTTTATTTITDTTTKADPFASLVTESSPPPSVDVPVIVPVSSDRKKFHLYGSIDRHQYMMVHKLWFKALHKLYDRSDAHQQAIKDWTRDSWLSMCRDRESLDHQSFTDALFELVDLWSLTVEPQEYIHFLATLYHRVTRVKTWLADDGSILTKYVWRRTKYVKPSAVYRPYQYNKYKTIQWKQASEVIHHLYSDSDNDSDDDEDDAVIKDLNALSDDDDDDDGDDYDNDSDNDREHDASHNDNDSDTDSRTSSMPSTASSNHRGGQHNRRSSSSYSPLIPYDGNSDRHSSPSVSLPPLVIDPQAVLRNLPEINMEPPMSPYLDPPAVIPSTPIESRSPRDSVASNDSDSDDDDANEYLELLSKSEEKLKSKLNVAIDVLDQRREDRFLRMIGNFTTLLDNHSRKLKRSNSMLVFDSSGVMLMRDIDPALKSLTVTSTSTSTKGKKSHRFELASPSNAVTFDVDVAEDARYHAIRRYHRMRRLSAPYDLSLYVNHNRYGDYDSQYYSNNHSELHSRHSTRSQGETVTDDDTTDNDNDSDNEGHDVDTSLPSVDERPHSANMSADDFADYMKSLQTDDEPTQRGEVLAFGNESDESSNEPKEVRDETQSVAETTPEPTAIQALTIETAPGPVDVVPLPSTRNGAAKPRPPSPVFMNQRVRTPKESMTPKRGPSSKATPSTKTKNLVPANNEEPTSEPVVEQPTSIAESTEAATVPATDSSDSDTPTSTETTTPSPALARIVSGSRGTSRVAQRLVESRDIRNADLESMRIRDEALAHEYDEDAMKARMALKSAQKRLMNEMDDSDSLAPQHSLEQTVENAQSLSERLTAAQEERTKAKTAKMHEMEEKRKREEEVRRKQRDEVRQAEEEAAISAAKAEQELFTLLHEADQQRKVEQQLKQQQREMAKKEKEARRKLKEEQHAQENAGVGAEETESAEKAGHGNVKPKPGKGDSVTDEVAKLRKAGKDKTALNSVPENVVINGSGNDTDAASVNDGKSDGNVKKREAAALAAARDAAVARRKAEKAEEERMRQQAIKDREDRLLDKSSKGEKKVLKAKTIARKSDEESASSGVSDDDEAGRIKVRPDFLKARKLERDDDSDSDDNDSQSVSSDGSDNGEKPIKATKSTKKHAKGAKNSPTAKESAAAKTDSKKSAPHAKRDGKSKADATKAKSAEANKFEQSKSTDAAHPVAESHSQSSDFVSTNSLLNKRSRAKRRHDSDDDDDDNNDVITEEDRQLAAEEARKYEFGADWTLEKKRAFREAEFKMEKEKEKAEMLASGELALAELKWASQKDKIKREEERLADIAEKERQHQLLAMQRAAAKEERMLLKEREMEEKRQEKQRKLELTEANRRALAQKKAHGTGDSSQDGQADNASSDGESDRASPAAAAGAKSVDSPADDEAHATPTGAKAARQAPSGIDKNARPGNKHGNATSDSLARAGKSSSHSLTDAKKFSMHASSIQHRDTTSSVASTASKSTEPKVIESSKSLPLVRGAKPADAAAEAKRTAAAKRREDAAKRSEQARLEREAKIQLAADKRLASVGLLVPDAHHATSTSDIDSAEAAIYDINRAEEARRHAEAAERSPFFRPMPPHHVLHSREADPLVRERPVELDAGFNQPSDGDAELALHDGEIKYWNSVTLEENPIIASSPTSPSHKSARPHYTVNELGVDNDETVQQQLLSLKQPAMRQWGFGLAKESDVFTEPTVREPHSPNHSNHLNAQELHDWQLNSARKLLAADNANGLSLQLPGQSSSDPSLTARALPSPLPPSLKHAEPLILEGKEEKKSYHEPPALAVLRQSDNQSQEPTPVTVDDRDFGSLHESLPMSLALSVPPPVKTLVDNTLMETANRKHTIDDASLSHLQSVYEESEASLYEAKARKYSLMEELITQVKLKNDRKRNRKYAIDAANEADQLAHRKAMETEILQWQQRKYEIFVLSQAARRARAEKAAELRAASINRQRARLMEDTHSKALLLDQWREKQVKIKQMQQAKEAQLQERLSKFKARELRILEKKRINDEQLAEERRALEERRQQQELRHLQLLHQREQLKRDEMARLALEAQQYREKLAADKLEAMQAREREEERTKKEHNKLAVLAVLEQIQKQQEEQVESASARAATAESTAVVEDQELTNFLHSVEDQEQMQKLREVYDTVLEELYTFHQLRKQRLKEKAILVRRAQLEVEERRREELAVLRSHKLKALNHRYSSGGGDATTAHSLINRHTARTPVRQQNNNSQTFTTSASVGDSSKDSAMLLAMKAKKSLDRLLLQQAFASYASQQRELVAASDEGKEEKVAVVILDQLDDHEGDSTEYQYDNDVLDEPSDYHTHTTTAVPAIKKMQPPKPTKTSHELLVTGAYSQQSLESLLQSLDSRHKSSDAYGTNISPNVPPSVDKKVRARRGSLISETRPLIVSNASHSMWGNTNEKFQLVGRKQRAFVKKAQSHPLQTRQTIHRGALVALQPMKHEPSASQQREREMEEKMAMSRPQSSSRVRLPAIQSSSARASPRSVNSAEVIISSKPSSAHLPENRDSNLSAIDTRLPPLEATEFLTQATEPSTEGGDVSASESEQQSLEKRTESVVDQPAESSEPLNGEAAVSVSHSQSQSPSDSKANEAVADEPQDEGEPADAAGEWKSTADTEASSVNSNKSSIDDALLGKIELVT